MPFWIISGAQRSPHTSNGQLWYHFGFNIVYQIHPNSFESVKIQPDPPTFGSAFSRLCEHMAQLSIRKSHSFGTAFPFERLSYGRIGLPFVNTFQSKRGSIRNGFGITPRALGAVGRDGPMGPFGVIPKPFRMVSYSEASPNGKAVPNGWLFRMESYSMRSLSRENAEPNACGFVWLDLNSFHKI